MINLDFLTNSGPWECFPLLRFWQSSSLRFSTFPLRSIRSFGVVPRCLHPTYFFKPNIFILIQWVSWSAWTTPPSVAALPRSIYRCFQCIRFVSTRKLPGSFFCREVLVAARPMLFVFQLPPRLLSRSPEF